VEPRGGTDNFHTTDVLHGCGGLTRSNAAELHKSAKLETLDVLVAHVYTCIFGC
jgi:hypothetical protein